MRNGRYIGDRTHTQTTGLNSADGGFASGAWPLHEYVNFLHPGLLGGVGGLLRSDTGSIGRAFTAALEPRCPGAGPCHDVPLLIGHRHNCIVERGVNVRLSIRDILSDLFGPGSARAGLSSCTGGWTSHRFLKISSSHGRLKWRLVSRLNENHKVVLTATLSTGINPRAEGKINDYFFFAPRRRPRPATVLFGPRLVLPF